MSGHSKWSTIKRKKARTDAKRGKVFSRLSKEITLAARSGGKDAETNPRLRAAISAAKTANVPNENIDRAIKKGSGELEGRTLEELSYEGYGPEGVAIMVDSLTDNRNRTAADIRHVFARANGNLANAGAVAWNFQRKARFLIEGEHADEEALMELFFDAGVDLDDLSVENGMAELIAPPEAFDDVVRTLEKAQIIPTESGIVRVPETQIAVTGIDTARKIVRLLDALEDCEDVQNIYANADISDELLEQLSEED